MSDLRPKYHITADKNWINDPNGLIKYKGQYHIFMQHHPFGLEWGPMHWAHVVSDDLLHFKHLPIALTPGDEFDKDGCFSGSSIVVNDRLYVVYTGFINNEKPEDIIQQQCLAYSDDGVNFVKLGLIIGKDKLPEGYASNDFRDPRIFKVEDAYYILVAARKIGGRGRILLYQSKDILNWEFVSDIADIDSKGIMIECPDYVKDLGLLLYSEQYKPAEGLLYLNTHSSCYRLGHFKNHKFKSKHISMIDYGFDFYAPQVFTNDHVMIAWMNMWERTQPSEQYGFTGQLTIPRRIEVKNKRLYQTPVLPNGDTQTIEFDEVYQEHVKYGFYKLNAKGLKEFELTVREGEKHKTTFSLIKKQWVFDRSHSGVVIQGKETDVDSLNGIRRMPFIKNKEHEIYIVLDEFSLEIFIDGISMTSTMYPDLKDDLLTLKVKCNSKTLIKYQMDE